jgi:peptidyl-dipeptidase Dcp
MRTIHAFVTCVFVLSAQITAVSAANSSDNPLLKESALPYHYPPFDKIKDEHFAPAIEAGMREQLKEVDAIANNSEKATFENTVVALEHRTPARPRRNHVFESQLLQHEPGSAKDRDRNGAQARRAPRCDPSQQQTFRADPGTL